MYHRNTQVLAAGLCKFVNGFSPKLINDCFKLNNVTVLTLETGPLSFLASSHNRSRMTHNRSRMTHNRSCMTQNPIDRIHRMSHLGPKMWEVVPSDMKSLSTFTAFKKVAKQLKPHACLSRLCRIYIYQVSLV